MNRSGPVLLLALMLACTTVRAQDEPLLRPSVDAELWLSGSVELRFDKDAKKKAKKAKDPKLTPEEQEKAEKRAEKAKRKFKSKFRLSGELGYRGNENLTSSKLFYTVLGARYRFNKYARLTLEHRYNFRDKYSNDSHRIDVQADTQYELGRVEMGYRLVFQHEFIIPIRYRDILRHRLQLTYRTKKFPIDPYASAESFGVIHFTGNKLIGMRYGIGMEWEMSKEHVFDFSLRHDREQNLENLQYRWIFGIAYEFKWSR